MEMVKKGYWEHLTFGKMIFGETENWEKYKFGKMEIWQN